MDRKHFLQTTALAATGIIGSPLAIYANGRSGIGDPLPADKVKAFVSAGHNNLDNVKKLLVEFPTLIYACWDLGSGDFETALEGAGHVGNKEIANYLISAGARTNLFVLAMLGKTEIVKPFLETFPQYLTARGPHGYTFLHHAQRGGDDAKELLEYFRSKGLTETKASL